MTNKESLILVRIGEVALKGLNRKHFTDRILKNLQIRLNAVGNFKTYSRESRLWIEALDEESKSEEKISEALDISTSVFGIVSSSIVTKMASTDFEALKAEALTIVGEEIARFNKDKVTFKVEARRGDKSFPLTSPEIGRVIGSHILKQYPNLSVDVHNPDFYLYIEVRDSFYIYANIHHGIKGLPVGTGGKATLLLSGGIDSPVAGYLMASRGVELNAVYYHSFPFTSDEAKEKVISLAKIISKYTGPIKLHIVNFTDIQVNLRQNSPGDMMTITMRRIMMQIAARIAEESGAKALVTGESLGQVASQTLEALCTTNSVVDMPVFRPLIGMDKDFTVDIARKIGTYETSILPYEDCCTVFVAKHPKTRPTMKDTEIAERDLDIEALIQDGFNKREILTIK